MKTIGYYGRQRGSSNVVDDYTRTSAATAGAAIATIQASRWKGGPKIRPRQFSGRYRMPDTWGGRVPPTRTGNPLSYGRPRGRSVPGIRSMGTILAQEGRAAVKMGEMVSLPLGSFQVLSRMRQLERIAKRANGFFFVLGVVRGVGYWSGFEQWALNGIDPLGGQGGYDFQGAGWTTCCNVGACGSTEVQKVVSWSTSGGLSCGAVTCSCSNSVSATWCPPGAAIPSNAKTVSIGRQNTTPLGSCLSTTRSRTGFWIQGGAQGVPAYKPRWTGPMPVWWPDSEEDPFDRPEAQPDAARTGRQRTGTMVLGDVRIKDGIGPKPYQRPSVDVVVAPGGPVTIGPGVHNQLPDDSDKSKRKLAFWLKLYHALTEGGDVLDCFFRNIPGVDARYVEHGVGLTVQQKVRAVAANINRIDVAGTLGCIAFNQGVVDPAIAGGLRQFQRAGGRSIALNFMRNL